MAPPHTTQPVSDTPPCSLALPRFKNDADTGYGRQIIQRNMLDHLHRVVNAETKIDTTAPKRKHYFKGNGKSYQDHVRQLDMLKYVDRLVRAQPLIDDSKPSDKRFLRVDDTQASLGRKRVMLQHVNRILTAEPRIDTSDPHDKVPARISSSGFNNVQQQRNMLKHVENIVSVTSNVDNSRPRQHTRMINQGGGFLGIMQQKNMLKHLDRILRAQNLVDNEKPKMKYHKVQQGAYSQLGQKRQMLRHVDRVLCARPKVDTSAPVIKIIPKKRNTHQRIPARSQELYRHYTRLVKTMAEQEQHGGTRRKQSMSRRNSTGKLPRQRSSASKASTSTSSSRSSKQQPRRSTSMPRSLEQYLADVDATPVGGSTARRHHGALPRYQDQVHEHQIERLIQRLDTVEHDLKHPEDPEGDAVLLRRAMPYTPPVLVSHDHDWALSALAPSDDSDDVSDDADDSTRTSHGVVDPAFASDSNDDSAAIATPQHQRRTNLSKDGSDEVHAKHLRHLVHRLDDYELEKQRRRDPGNIEEHPTHLLRSGGYTPPVLAQEGGSGGHSQARVQPQPPTSRRPMTRRRKSTSTRRPATVDPGHVDRLWAMQKRMDEQDRQRSKDTSNPELHPVHLLRRPGEYSPPLLAARLSPRFHSAPATDSDHYQPIAPCPPTTAAPRAAAPRLRRNKPVSSQDRAVYESLYCELYTRLIDAEMHQCQDQAAVASFITEHLAQFHGLSRQRVMQVLRSLAEDLDLCVTVSV